MSQTDPQDSLARLQETIAQLQAIATSLEQEKISLSETALADLATDTAKLVVALKASSKTVEPSVESVSQSEAPPTSDEWDGDIFEDASPTPEVQPKVSERPAVSSRIKRRASRPWWQDQKVVIGALSAAIALIFVWKLATRAPEVALEATQPSDTSPQTEIVSSEQLLPEQPSAAPPLKPKPVTPPVAEPAPEPVRPLTPEQRLVAAIQSQINDVTQPYGDNIVRSVEADFQNSMLRITVGDAWYLLKAGLQDRLGAEVLELSQILDFKKLRVEDLKGNFVARNPVVGDALVIVRRYEEFQE